MIHNPRLCFTVDDILSPVRASGLRANDLRSRFRPPHCTRRGRWFRAGSECLSPGMLLTQASRLLL